MWTEFARERRASQTRLAINLTARIRTFGRGTPAAQRTFRAGNRRKACPVVELDGDGRSRMKHGASRELYEYWNRVRGSERAPHRSAIEPSDIRRILADTFILEVVDRANYQVRLAGTRVCSLYCRELKGSNFFDLWQGDDRSAIGTLSAAVSEDGAAAVVTVEGRTERDQDVAAELILLPLRHAGDTFDRVLGSLAVLERPYWLGTEAVVRQSIASLRLIWPDEAPTFLRRRTDPQPPTLVSVAAAQTIPFPGASRRRAHLTVLEGGKDRRTDR